MALLTRLDRIAAEADLERRFSCDTLGNGKLLPLREILARLRNSGTKENIQIDRK